MYVYADVHEREGDTTLFIKFQNIERNEDNVIIKGTASVVLTTYKRNKDNNRTKCHNKTKVIERLGKVLWRDDADRTCGIFASPTRGIVFYDVKTDEFTPVKPDDPRLKGTRYECPPVMLHTTFGRSYLFFLELSKTPLLKVLNETFSSNERLYEKALAHLAHDCLKNKSAIKCGEFLREDVLSYLLTKVPVSELDCDSSYYQALADDNLKTAFFQNLVKEMRKIDPEFGRGAYVDSTPLPGEAENNPFNALCSHGTDGTVIQSRLVLILDIKWGIPVWFEVIPSNVLDKCTIMSITRDVKATLDVDIDMYDLDAGYSRQELYEAFNRDNNTYIDEEGILRDHTVLLRMPSGSGYPRDELYTRCKPHFYTGRYQFDYEHHTFFGERVETDLFGCPEYAFVYIDKTEAEGLLRKWRQEDPAHQEEWDSLTDKGQDWYQVKDGFFILAGNKDQSAKEALVEYRGRTHIEGFFRDSKTYLKILPLAKWKKETVKGKIFHDVMETILYRAFRKEIAKAGKTVSSLIVEMDSWECFKLDDNLLELKTPKTQVRETFEKLGYSVKGHMSLDDLEKMVFGGAPMNMEPVTAKTKKSTKAAPSVQKAPDEKLQEKEDKRIAKAEEEAKKRLEKAVNKAEKALEREEKKADDALARSKTSAENQLGKAEAAARKEKTKEKAREVCSQKIADAEAKCASRKKVARDQYDQAIKAAGDTYKKAMADAMSPEKQPKLAERKNDNGGKSLEHSV